MSGERIASLLGIGVGLYWCIQGYIYGFWYTVGPGPGFIPVLFGSLCFLLNIVLFRDSFKVPGTRFLPKEIKVVVLLSVFIAVAVLLMRIVGTMPTLALMLFLWLFILERFNWLRSLKISLFSVFVFYLVFTVWLRVPLPKGFLGL